MWVVALPEVGRFTNDTALELVVTTSAPNTAIRDRVDAVRLPPNPAAGSWYAVEHVRVTVEHE